MPTGNSMEVGGADTRAEAAVDQKRDSIVAAGTTERAASLAASNIHEGSVIADDSAPTAEDLVTLRRVPTKIPKKLFTIAFVELCERFSYYGTTVVCKSPDLELLLNSPQGGRFLLT